MRYKRKSIYNLLVGDIIFFLLLREMLQMLHVLRKVFKKLIIKNCLVVKARKKQPPTGVLRKRYSENIKQIYRTSMPKYDFNNVALQLY